MGLTGILFADAARRTDPDGRCSFAALPRGEYVVAFRRDALERWHTEPSVDSGSEVELRLPPRRDVVLRIQASPSSASPSSLDDVRCQLWSGPTLGEVTASGLQESLRVALEVVDAASGTWVLRGVDPGVYTLGVRARGYAFHQRLLVVRDEPVAEPLLIELAPGVDCEIEVVDEAGAPIHAAEVYVLAEADEKTAFSQSILYSYGGFSSWSRLGRGGSRTDVRGRVRVAALPLGPAELLVRHRARGTVAVTVPELTGVVRVTMRKGGGMTGTVRRSGAIVDPASIRVSLQPGEAANGASFPEATLGVRVTADGRFDVDGLAPGSWQISVTLADDEAVRSIGGLVMNAEPKGWPMSAAGTRQQSVTVRPGGCAARSAVTPSTMLAPPP